MSLKIKNYIGGGENFIYKISISHQPNTINYLQGESLDLTGLIIVGYYSNGDIVEITDKCIFSPEEGTVLDVTNDKIVIYMKGSGCAEYYTEQGIKVVIPVVFENVLNINTRSMCKGNNKYLSSGNGNYYSLNGITWTQNTSCTKQFTRIAYGNNTYVGIVYGEGPYYSTDGISWTKANISSVEYNSDFGIYYDTNRNIFIIAGNNNWNDNVYYSTNGINWTEISFSSYERLSGNNFDSFKNNIIFLADYKSSGCSLYYFSESNNLSSISGFSGELKDFTVTDNYIYVSTSSGIYRCSSANFNSWEKVSDIVSTYIKSCNNNIYIINNGKWNQTTDFNELIELNILYRYNFHINYGNNKYLILPIATTSDMSNNFVYYSDDGIIWNKSNLSNTYIRDYICDKENMIWLVSSSSDGVFYWK